MENPFLKITLRLLGALVLAGASTFSATAQSPVTQAQAAQRVGELLNAGDYGTLDAVLPSVRDSLPASLAALSDALTAYHSGRHAESNAAIAKLEEYTDELGRETVLNMHHFAIYNYLVLNDYAAASDTIRQLLDCLPADAGEARRSLEDFGRWMKALANWPATTLHRPEGEAVIPIEIQQAGRGEHLLLDVEMNGRTEPFIFDTGCSGANFISESAAARLGVRILADSIPVTGMVTAYTRVGVADSLRIGEIVVLHPTFIVAPDSISGLGVSGLVEAVLGTDIIRAMGEVRIEVKQRRIVLPAVPSAAPAHRNLNFDIGKYDLTCTQDGTPLILHFDTGNVKSTLSQRYYNTYRRHVRRTGKKTTSLTGGFGGTRELTVRTLPHITLHCGGHPITLHNITVTLRGKDMDAARDHEYGSLGLDFITACDRVVIDLGRMFVRTE